MYSSRFRESSCEGILLLELLQRDERAVPPSAAVPEASRTLPTVDFVCHFTDRSQTWAIWDPSGLGTPAHSAQSAAVELQVRVRAKTGLVHRIRAYSAMGSSWAYSSCLKS